MGRCDKPAITIPESGQGAREAVQVLNGYVAELDQDGQHGAGYMIDRMADDIAMWVQ